MVQALITKHIHKALEKLNISFDGDIHIEHPNDLSHGDYSVNIAMVLAKQEGVNPRELALKIVDVVEDDEYIEKLEVAGPGFINFYLSEKFFAESIENILKEQGSFGDSKLFASKKVLVEHSSPNLFKPFHIGHLVNNTIGEALARLYKKAGAEVVALSYPSDVSLGIGKAVWKLLQDGGVEKLDELETTEEKISYLGWCYKEGTVAYDEQDIEHEVRSITQDIYDKNENSVGYQAYLRGKDINLQYFKDITIRLGSSFDGFIYESEAGVLGKEVVTSHTPEVFTESEGATIYEGERYGLHTRVFINKDGNPTYEAKDIGLLKLKFDQYHPDLSILVTDSQQGEYYKVVLDAAGRIEPSWKEQSFHATHGRMQFKGQKMSSRLGNTPLVADILKEVNKEVFERSTKELEEQEADAISLASLKYTILRTQAGKDLNFDPETSLSFEGDSGPYLQYTYARCQSLLRKAEGEKVEGRDELTSLERYLYRYEEVVQQAVVTNQPHHVVGFLTELAQYFNSWYGSTKIIGSENMSHKLKLVEATSYILKSGLEVLGIEALNEM